MSELPIIDDLAGFAPTAVFLGDGCRADCVWTRQQFLTLCEYMLNGNPQDEFLHVYRDRAGTPRFVKARNAKAIPRITWAWDAITGRAKHKVAVGFYPWNERRESRWAAMDFDAHDGDAKRAKSLAVAALQILVKKPELSLILTSSGSDGWHVFVLSERFHPIADWVLLLKRTAAAIGAEVQAGRCEIFPNETCSRTSRPHGIRAPETWNPKTDEVGAIIFESVTPLLRRREKKEESSFLYPSTKREKGDQLNDSDSARFYTGDRQSWPEQFAITEPGTRHAQLRALVYCVFRQVSRRVALLNAQQQYRRAEPRPNASSDEHLEEFENLWIWVQRQWENELTSAEQHQFSTFASETERDLFRILRNFAHHAAAKNQDDFPFPIEHVANRLGVSFQHVSKLRQRFVENGLIEQTEASVTNRSAARFRWALKPNQCVAKCLL